MFKLHRVYPSFHPVSAVNGMSPSATVGLVNGWKYRKMTDYTRRHMEPRADMITET